MPRVTIIITDTTPLKIGNVIICRVFIYVVNNWKMVRIWNKSGGYKTMHAEIIQFSTLREGDRFVPVFVGTYSEKLLADEAKPASLRDTSAGQAFNPSKIGDFIQSFKAFYWHPNFFHRYPVF